MLVRGGKSNGGEGIKFRAGGWGKKRKHGFRGGLQFSESPRKKLRGRREKNATMTDPLEKAELLERTDKKKKDTTEDHSKAGVTLGKLTKTETNSSTALQVQKKREGPESN